MRTGASDDLDLATNSIMDLLLATKMRIAVFKDTPVINPAFFLGPCKDTRPSTARIHLLQWACVWDKSGSLDTPDPPIGFLTIKYFAL